MLHTNVGNTRTRNTSQIPQAQRNGCVLRPHEHVVQLLGLSFLWDNGNAPDNMHLHRFQDLDLRSCPHDDLIPHNCYAHDLADPPRNNILFHMDSTINHWITTLVQRNEPTRLRNSARLGNAQRALFKWSCHCIYQCRYRCHAFDHSKCFIRYDAICGEKKSGLRNLSISHIPCSLKPMRSNATQLVPGLHSPNRLEFLVFRNVLNELLLMNCCISTIFFTTSAVEYP